LSTGSSTSVVVVLVGPTASGKTALLDELFGSYASRKSRGLPEAEVVSADSMQAYRGMDIGTAKPDAGLRSRLPHRLIDILDPREQYTAGDFVRLADEACAAIAAAGKLPIVSGGTGFYARNFICGLPAAPAADPALRARVASDLASRGEAELRAELERADPASASRIHRNDLYRLTRAVEIVRATGRPLADFAAGTSPREGRRFLVVGVERGRAELAARIDARVDEMIGAGLSDEVASLASSGLGPGDPGMKAIGYREFFDPESGGGPGGAAAELGAVAAAIKADTRSYAKRQMTFSRALPGIRWIAPDADALAFLLEDIVRSGGFAL
jgi:tRNA dimethylallyltransferase